jgi:hypothetical protein
VSYEVEVIYLECDEEPMPEGVSGLCYWWEHELPIAPDWDI